MRNAFSCVVLFTSALAAQPATPANNIIDTLKAITRAGASSVSLSAQLVDEMMSMAPQDRQPSRGALAGFANVFTAALMGKDLTSAQISALQRSIAELLSGSGTNLKPAGVLRETLTSIGVGVPIQSIITRFVAMGEEVRGPDDIREQPPLPRYK
jgi:hypothetical protein